MTVHQSHRNTRFFLGEGAFRHYRAVLPPLPFTNHTLAKISEGAIEMPLPHRLRSGPAFDFIPLHLWLGKQTQFDFLTEVVGGNILSIFLFFPQQLDDLLLTAVVVAFKLHIKLLGKQRLCRIRLLADRPNQAGKGFAHCRIKMLGDVFFELLGLLELHLVITRRHQCQIRFDGTNRAQALAVFDELLVGVI